MIKNQEIEGIILRIFETTNNGYILKILSQEFSLITAYAPFAKNSKRRYGQLDLFDWGYFTIREKTEGQFSLQEFEARSSFPKIRQSLDSIVSVSLIAEILEQLTPEGELHTDQNFQIFKNYLLGIEDLSQLSEILKKTHHCLIAILKNVGILEDDILITPTAKNFLSLIDQTENYLGKKLKLRGDVSSLIKRLKTTQV